MPDWRTPEEIVEVGFSRSTVVMANEAHSGMRRCIRTREVGRRLLPVAHRSGVRHLAMEALGGPYVEQPDLAALIADARSLGWTLIAYESTDPRSPFLPGGGLDYEIANTRELDQARNLAEQLPDTPLLVWCGNSHHEKRPAPSGWSPMGMFFRELTGIDFFAIDQTWTVFGDPTLGEGLRADLEPLGGTAGLLREELPPPFDEQSADAILFSVDNTLT